MRRALIVLTIAAAAAAAAATVTRAGEAGEPRQVQRKVVRLHAGGEAIPGMPDVDTMEGDRLKIEDLAELLPGEARSYYTESGREVVVTRGEGERYTLEVEGKKVVLGGEAEAELLALHGAGGEGGERRIIVHHRKDAGLPGDAAEAGEAGEAGEATVEKDVVTITPHAGAALEGGEPPVIVEIVSEAEGKVEKRVVVLRLDEPAEQ